MSIYLRSGRRLLAVLLAAVFGCLSFVNRVHAYTASQLHASMGVGLNYGEYFEKKGERNILKGAIPAAHFTAIKNAGFGHVRIPVTWGYRINTWPSAGNPVTINATFLASVKTSVDRALAAGLIVVVNTHHEDWFQYYWAAKSNAVIKLDRSGADQSGYPWEYKLDPTGRGAMSIYKDIYKQIVTTFDSPTYDNLVLEGLNEPAYKVRNKANWGGNSTWQSNSANYLLAFDPANGGDAKVNDLNQQIFTVMQDNDINGARRTYSMTVNNMNNHYSYDNLTLPTYSTWTLAQRLDRLMATLHYYHSFNWTHPSGSPDNSWGTTTDYDELHARLDHARDARDRSFGGLCTNIGEFGIAHNERVGRSDAEVEAWYRAVTAAAKNRNFTATVWDDGGWFRVLNHSTGAFATNGREAAILDAATDYLYY